jgi:hypothetical protein
MATKKRYLTGEQRLILEENGVIDAPQVPRSDQLEESIRARGWGLGVSVSAKGFATAKVTSDHGSFDGAGDHSDVAIVEALCATLKARPRNFGLFDERASADLLGEPNDDENAPKKSPKNRSVAQPPSPEESAIIGEDRVLGHLSASNGNGSHDSDDVAGILMDPKTVVATLTEAGIPIVHNGVAYSHPSGMPVYSNAWVEGEMRGLMAGRAR